MPDADFEAAKAELVAAIAPLKASLADIQNRVRGPEDRPWDQLQELVDKAAKILKGVEALAQTLRGFTPNSDRLNDVWRKLLDIERAVTSAKPADQ